MPKPSVWWWDGRGASLSVALAFALLLGGTSAARAEGAQFPADGTRNLGRGGSGMARADDPTVMLRNPALLADLWDDQALLSAHLGEVDACFTPTGSAFWQAPGSGLDTVDLGNGPITTSEWNNEPLARLCYEGPGPFTPSVAFSSKLSDTLGVGIGFFPPEQATLLQWGNRDGTYETPNGLRLNPLRYLGSHLNTTYFSLLGAVGYRPFSWLRFGVGFQWALAVADATTFSTSQSNLQATSDIRVDLFTRDLFIPGVIASVHLVPFDALDVAFGFKWSDRVKAKAKLDLLTSPYGVTDYEFEEGATRGVAVPTASNNVPGQVDAPPIWSPQISASVRYAQRLRPRPRDWEASREAADGMVEDHMSSELFDLELTAVYVLNSAYDQSVFYSDPEVASATLRSLQPNGTIASTETTLGRCREEDRLATGGCGGLTENPVPFGGKDQWSLRFGGDYNIFPGLFAVRAGVSYETDGADRAYMNPRYYMFQRIGLHGGLTLRVFGKTDIHLAYAHFIQDKVRVQFNGDYVSAGGGVNLPETQRTPEFNYLPGEHDGKALVPIVYSKAVTPGPNFANAGSFFYNLDILSVAVSQHF